MKNNLRTEEEVFILWMMLDMEFMVLKPTTPDEVGQQLFNLLLWKERIKNGMERTAKERAISDNATIKKMRTWDTRAPELIALEKVLRLLATKNSDGAMLLLKRLIDNNRIQLRRQLQKIAKQPRKARHPLSTIVDPIVKASPDITENKLFYEVLRVIDKAENPVCNFNSNSFKPTDKKYPDVPRKNLSQYLSRAKKKLLR